jgi:hypothetical protein
MEHKLTAILSADVQGYSRLMGKNQEATIHTLAAYRSFAEARKVVAALRSEEFGEKGTFKNFETILVSQSGKQIPVVMSGSVIYDEMGAEIGMIGFLKDL